MMSLVASALLPNARAADTKITKTPLREGTAGSRSTSAGSSSPHSSNPEDFSSPFCVATGMGLPELAYPSTADLQNDCGLPEIDYPAPFLVKNTFIETKAFQPSSLDGFLHKRMVQSCPASGICPPPGLEDDFTSGIEVDRPCLQAATPDAESFARAVALAALDAEVDGDAFADITPSPKGMFLPPPSFGFDMQFPCMPPPAPPQDVPVMDCLLPPPPQQPPVLGGQLERAEVPPPPALAPVLLLADALPEPAFGSNELPSVGSVGHHIGACKPCAFFHSKGCGNGKQCQFCHLCDQGEKKRRLKEKRAMMRG